MFRLIWIGLLLCFAAWLGLSLHEEMGQVVLVFKHTTIELPLWLGAVIVMLGVAVIYALMRMLNFLVSWPKGWRNISKARHKRKALSLANQGWIALAEGEWLHAERNLIRSAIESESPLLNYLGAAEAAQSQGAHARRDKYLELASHLKGSELAVGLKAAEFELNHGQLEQCLERLDALKQAAPKHPAVLNLLKRLYIVKRDWANLLVLLPLLKKHAGCNTVEYEQLERQVYSEILRGAALSESVVALTTAWKDIPSRYHQEPYFISLYVEGLASHRAYELAEKILTRALKQQWQLSWVRLYGVIEHAHPSRALSTAEGWATRHANCAELFLTLGRLAIKCELWAKAERYLEVSITLSPDPETYVELGRLYESLKRLEQSHECYRKGLLLAASPESLGREIAPVVPSSVNSE